jgi:hypothetical protein
MTPPHPSLSSGRGPCAFAPPVPHGAESHWCRARHVSRGRRSVLGARHTCPAVSHRRAAGLRGTNGGGRCQGAVALRLLQRVATEWRALSFTTRIRRQRGLRGATGHATFPAPDGYSLAGARIGARLAFTFHFAVRLPGFVVHVATRGYNGLNRIAGRPE